MIYGEKGIGKSTLAAQFPDTRAHFILEPGRVGLEAMLIPRRGEPALTWVRMKEYLQLCLKESEPGRIVIDTCDGLAKLLEKHQAASMNIPTIRNLNDYGKTYDLMYQERDSVFLPLIYAGWRFTLVSHSRNRPKIVRGIARDDLKEAEREGVIVTETQPSSTGWMYDWSKVICEFVGYYSYYGYDRVLYVRGNQRMYASAGVGRKHFLDPKTKEPYHAIPMGRSEEDAWKNLNLAWENKLRDGIVTETEEAYVDEPSE